jgi:hypothetical protein
VLGVLAGVFRVLAGMLGVLGKGGKSPEADREQAGGEEQDTRRDLHRKFSRTKGAVGKAG